MNRKLPPAKSNKIESKLPNMPLDTHFRVNKLRKFPFLVHKCLPLCQFTQALQSGGFYLIKYILTISSLYKGK